MNLKHIIRTLEQHDFVLAGQQRAEAFEAPLSPYQLLVFEHRDAVDAVHVTHDGTRYCAKSISDSREAIAALNDLRAYKNGGTKS